MDEFALRLASIEQELFCANGYRGVADAPEYLISPGSMPALVSAPHAVTHIRKGEVKPSEDFTGTIALEIAQRASCHAMVATRTAEGDPNWDPIESSAYKQAMARHVNEHGIALVIDLHGMIAASPALVAVGSGDGACVSRMPGLDERAYAILCDQLDPWCRKWDKPVVLNGRYAARRDTTIAQTIARESSCASLQIEVATQLRVPLMLRGKRPAGERNPFTSGQIPIEIAARRNPSPEAIEALIGALVEIVQLGCNYLHPQAEKR